MAAERLGFVRKQETNNDKQLFTRVETNYLVKFPIDEALRLQRRGARFTQTRSQPCTWLHFE